MSYLKDVIFRLRGSPGVYEKFFSRLEGAQGEAHLNALRAYVASYQPNGTNYGYVAEMDNRVKYLNGAMQSDMNEILKRQFPQTHKDYLREQVNLTLLQSIIMERARVFPESTRYVLMNRETGKELEPSDKADGDQAKEFQAMIEAGLWPTGFRQGDAYAQLCHRTALKAWYDQDIEDVRLSAYPPQDVMIVRNPFRTWSPYTAPAVMFRHSSAIGSGCRDVWEVWSTGSLETPDGEDEAGLPIWLPTAHYMTDGEKEWSVNPGDVNPFLDPRHDKRPIVPYTWMSDDGGTDLYVFGAEDVLTLNRDVNWGMTSLNISVINQAFATMVLRTDAGKSVKLPKDMVLSPRRAHKLPVGVTLEYVSPELDISGPSEFYETLMKYDALLSGLGTDVVTVEGGQVEESGRALQIRQTRLEKILAPLRENYKNPAEEALAKGVIVRNYYIKRVKDRVEIDLVKYKPTVVYGDLKVPVNDKEEGETFTVEIEHDVSTNVDWHMKKYGVSKAEAISRLAENAAYNEEARQARRVIPVDEPDEEEEEDTTEEEGAEEESTDQGDDSEE